MKSVHQSPRAQIHDVNADPEPERPSEIPQNDSPLLSAAGRSSCPSRASVKVLCGGGQWCAYAALGIFTALLSFLMDLTVTKLLRAHMGLYMKLEGNTLLQFCCWTLYPACLCAFASSFSHNICPFSTGSGIPEVRAMLAGFEVPHFLSLTNMFVKSLGLICTLAAGSTVFLGKVGPFVHLSSMLGAYLNKLCREKHEAAEEMLVVAAAVGVSSCFGAPISGVLFSVEIMSSHFSLRNYCPCFFSAACGAVTFNLFSVWSGNTETLQALFKTHFPAAVPFLPVEILLFAFLGLLCGAAGCCYLCCHRWMLSFTKTNPAIVRVLTTQKALYSGLVAFLLASLTFPRSVGRYMVSEYTMKQLLTSLLDSRQWSVQSQNASVDLEPLMGWSTSESSVWFSLSFFLLMKIWMLVLACSLPLPAGYFMPVFVWGAAMGRLLGEAASVMMDSSVNPGGYALAGAAAFSGAVTHTLSPVLLAVELTGQITHVVPVLIATLLANAVTQRGQRPSFYDAISISKKLPHLPSLQKAYPGLFLGPIGRVLRGKPVQLQLAAGPVEVQHVLSTSTDAHIPVVDSHESQVLMGLVVRADLQRALRHWSAEGRLTEVCSIHPVSVEASPHCSVQQVYSLLSLLRYQTVYVVDGGRLLGHVTHPEMKRILEDMCREM